MALVMAALAKSPELLNSHDEEGASALVRAIQIKSREMVVFLLNAGADFLATNAVMNVFVLPLPCRT